MRSLLSGDSDLTVSYHKSCASSYTSETNIERVRPKALYRERRIATREEDEVSVESISFKEQCVFFGKRNATFNVIHVMEIDGEYRICVELQREVQEGRSKMLFSEFAKCVTINGEKK